MTEVQFHVKVADRVGYSCRLLRKALRLARKGVAVIGAADLLAELDRYLWVFEEYEFLPHVRLRAGEAAGSVHQRTPVWLVDDAGAAAHLPVLVNLGIEPPAGFESFERLVEIVSADEHELAAGRRRWKHYVARGYAVNLHEAQA